MGERLDYSGGGGGGGGGWGHALPGCRGVVCEESRKQNRQLKSQEGTLVWKK